MTLRPIATTVTRYQRDKMVANVVRTYEAATVDQFRRGMGWYSDAHNIAREYGDAATGAGVIAALSANKSWSENVRLARIALSAREITSGHVGNALWKANAIMAGTPAEMVLPMTKKTGHFYRCILDPSDAEAVCIDRHAHDIAVGVRYGDADRGLSTQSRYDLFADVYRRAAKRVGMLPQIVQAISWTVQVESK